MERGPECPGLKASAQNISISFPRWRPFFYKWLVFFYLFHLSCTKNFPLIHTNFYVIIKLLLCAKTKKTGVTLVYQQLHLTVNVISVSDYKCGGCLSTSLNILYSHNLLSHTHTKMNKYLMISWQNQQVMWWYSVESWITSNIKIK